MRHTRKSLAFVWLIAFGLFVLTASGEMTGPGLLSLLAVALAAPALILRNAVAKQADRRCYEGVRSAGWDLPAVG